MREKSPFLNVNYVRPTSIDTEVDTAGMPGGKTGIHAVDAAEAVDRKNLEDGLTGCYNEKYFEKYIAENFDPVNSHGEFGILYLDIDHLKAVNDSQGHAAGNIMIKDFADYIKGHFKKRSDVVIRIGGDEFVVLFQDRTKTEEDICSILTQRLDSDAGVQFSFGCAVFDKTLDQDISDTMVRADAKMYAQKHAKDSYQVQPV